MRKTSFVSLVHSYISIDTICIYLTILLLTEYEFLREAVANIRMFANIPIYKSRRPYSYICIFERICIFGTTPF